MPENEEGVEEGAPDTGPPLPGIKVRPVLVPGHGLLGPLLARWPGSACVEAPT